MYHPAVNLTNPGGVQTGRALARCLGKPTCDARDESILAYAAGTLVSVVEHLEHCAHLFSAVVSLVLDDLEVGLRRAVDLDDSVSRV